MNYENRQARPVQLVEEREGTVGFDSKDKTYFVAYQDGTRDEVYGGALKGIGADFVGAKVFRETFENDRETVITFRREETPEDVGLKARHRINTLFPQGIN